LKTLALTIAVCSLTALASGARAQQPPPAFPAPPTYGPGYGQAPPQRIQRPVPMRTRKPHALYADLGGRGIFYGVGYDYCILDWLALGASFSYFKMDHVAHVLVNPYVSFYPARGIRHALYISVGANIVHFSDDTEVLGIDVFRADGVGLWGNVGLGWEYRHHFLFRTGVMAFFSEGGIIPWFGLTLGGAV
jgi:hypothetical protein